MAIYFVNVQVISRGDARTSTGAAAYRAGERIYDVRTGQTFDYTRRSVDIETEILAPEGAPEWAYDREQLWNGVEAAEKRCDAQLAREMVVAIPIELSPDRQRELIHGYVQDQFVSQGMVADVAIHRNPGNPHAHIMLTMREMTPEGFAAKKNRDWNRPEMLERWRAEWASHANRALELAGREERIDRRSLADQGSERLPQVHLGPHAAALERRGVATEKGDLNRVVEQHNATVVDLEKARAEKKALEVEKAVTTRMESRLAGGWQHDQAKALADLEGERGGSVVTVDALTAEQRELNARLGNINETIRRINEEGWRLERAAEAVKDHVWAVQDLRRHQGPLAGVRRLFNEEARRAYEDALDRTKWTEKAMKAQGVLNQADLQHQQARWKQEEAARLPGLKRQAEPLEKRLEKVSRAHEGYRQEDLRKREKADKEMRQRVDRLEELARQRSRAREIDRGR